jgi:hypothetical protein
VSWTKRAPVIDSTTARTGAAAADVLYQLMLTRNAIVDGSTIKHTPNANAAPAARAARTHRKGVKLSNRNYRGET